MDKLDAVLTGGRDAQLSVIGSMLIDDACVPLVLSRLRPEDFVDGTCRATFTAIRKLAQEGRPVEPVTVVDAMQGGEKYVHWLRDAMELTTTAANVEEYITITREKAMLYRFRELCGQGQECLDMETAAELSRKISTALSATERMPMMTGPERSDDFIDRMKNPEKAKYLPWGIPTADRSVYAELGDMILLGGYASSGKTLLSILMAQTQAKAGYKVGYYSLETSPEKITDRQMAALAGVPLKQIKRKDFTEEQWYQLAEASNCAASVCPFDVVQAAGSTVDDIIYHAIGHGYQVIYVDYVQLLRVPGVRDSDGYARVTAASQALKTFAQNTKTAVVALAQLSRPQKDGGKPAPPTMHSFKESGQLEQDADVAFLIYPSDGNDNNSDRVFKIGKNKEGPRAAVRLSFRGDTQTMVELEEQPDTSVAAELSAKGRAVKQKNRAQAQQAEFQELTDGNEENPFDER